MSITDAIALAQSLYNSGDLSVDQADPILEALGEAQGTISRLQGELGRIKTHTPGRYAFQHRHYALSLVRQREPALHEWACNEAIRRIDQEGGATYEEYVGKLEADNAALRQLLEASIALCSVPEHAWGDEHDAERDRIDAALAAPHPGANITALLSAARAYRDAWQGTSLPMGPLAIGEHWERLRAAIDAMDGDTTAPTGGTI